MTGGGHGGKSDVSISSLNDERLIERNKEGGVENVILIARVRVQLQRNHCVQDLTTVKSPSVVALCKK